ncbi:hypothetical protein IW262DRAFT_1468978 [Armillaria fumosa]|nr:hypothetical protein IW262DRAFT_1468978 [Armillaria fumosa]
MPTKLPHEEENHSPPSSPRAALVFLLSPVTGQGAGQTEPLDVTDKCYVERWQNAIRYAEKALYKVLTMSIVLVITEELRMSDVRSSVVCTSNNGYILHSLPTTATGILSDTFFLQRDSVCATICDNQMTIIRIPDCDFGWEAPSTILMSSRPKTSHTTIEHQYRTNLNARIQSLCMAVPVL